MENKKMMFTSLSIISVLVFVIGTAYALYSFSKTSNNSNLVVGNIYMHYDETNGGINLSGMVPSKTYNKDAYFEFTIDGENTYSDKDINYEIVLNYGDDHATRKTRIKDGLLNFRLVQLDYNTTSKTYGNEQVLFDNRSYESISDKRIWEDVITKSDGYVKRMYRLYMWYAYYTNIGNSSDADYDLDTWNNDVFASIKVNVTGDFTPKSIEANASCFTSTSTAASSTITAYDETCGTDLIIPSQINGVDVTEISASAFKGKGLTSVVIPDTVTTIGNSAFQNNSIKTLKLSNSIQKIPNYAFDNNKLTSIDIPSSVTSIGNSAFRNNQITSLILPDTITTLENYGFQKNKISELVLPNSITSIPAGCFAYNELTSVNIPSSVTRLSGFDNNKLTSITIPSGVTDLSGFANNQITDLVIPDTVTTLAQGSFYNNKLKSLILPSKIKTIPNGCFNNNNLTNVTIPESVTILAGFDNNQITSVNIPSNVTNLSGFSGNKLTSITIPNSVIHLSGLARNKLKSITIPESVTSISGLSNNQITSIEILGTGSSISIAGLDNNKLTSITLPDSVTSIGANTFKGNDLKTVTIGKNILYIATNAFEKSSTSNPNLESITLGKTCNEIKTGIRSTRLNGSSIVYPWLSSTSPYTATGVTIYGTDGVCDSY